MSAPTWRLTIDTTDNRITPGGKPNVWIVEGSGPRPVLVDLAPPPPPGDPADPPPAGDPYAPQPGEDTSPFAFPTDGPTWPTDPNGDRNYALAVKLPGSDYYACEQNAGNPSVMSHVNAGIIAPGGRTDYGSAPSKAVGGLRLWVRAVAGEAMTGARIPPAPPHLIRRALARGRL